MDSLEIFVNRLKKNNIHIELSSNYPWIYLDKINGNVVYEKYLGNHGFTLAFFNINGTIGFNDLKLIFKIIRKYK